MFPRIQGLPHKDENIVLDVSAESHLAEPARQAEIVSDASAPHSSLKKPMPTPQSRRAKKRREFKSCNFIKKVLRQKELNALDELRDMELKKIRHGIRQQKELHDQKIKLNEEKHKLEMIKLQLEVDSLKNEINNSN